MRVMIVEDQQIILSGIKKMIEDEISCEIVTALSGAHALKRILSAPPPDVVISDIVMPGMDGLSFIEQAKRLLPFCHFLIISGHDRFSFAQKAIQLGVSDYFLKPIERRRLLDALKNIRDQQNLYWERLCAVCMRDFCLIQSAETSVKLHLEGIRAGQGVKAAFYCVRNGVLPLHESLPGCYFMGKTPKLALYLIFLPDPEFSEVHQRILSENKQICFGMDWTGNSALAFQRCAEQDDNRFFSKDTAGAAAFSCAGELRRLDEALASGEGREESVKAALSALFYKLERASGPAQSVRAAVKALMDQLLANENDFDTERMWQCAESYEEFLNAARTRLNAWMDGSREGREDSVILRMKRYVDAHCAQPLNVKSVACSAAVSPNYASSLFKRETGESLSSYIRRRQLEAAKHLLLSTNMRVYEIAEQLGYADEKHFSSIFRLQYHVSPNAVRRMQQERATTEE